MAFLSKASKKKRREKKLDPPLRTSLCEPRSKFCSRLVCFNAKFTLVTLLSTFAGQADRGRVLEIAHRKVACARGVFSKQRLAFFSTLTFESGKHVRVNSGEEKMGHIKRPVFESLPKEEKDTGDDRLGTRPFTFLRFFEIQNEENASLREPHLGPSDSSSKRPSRRSARFAAYI